MKIFSKLVFSAIIALCTINVAFAQNHEVKNIIYMIGDGMGVSQVTMLILEEDLGKIQMERATSVGLVRTFSANNRVTDSAAAGTALATGTKTNNGTLGLGPDGGKLTSIMEKAILKGLPAGLVVTCQLPHATPAAFYAHVDKRTKYKEIAAQLVDSNIDVMFGGGLNDFIEREDGRNLVEELRNKGYKVETELSAFDNVTSGKTTGIFSEAGSLPYAIEGRGNYLPEATAKALEILNNNSEGNGFFLMVEGSMIDYAGHSNNTDRLIGEMKDFDSAVGVAFDFADANPGTLVVVLADHETGGLTIPSNEDDFTSSESGIQYLYSSKSHTGTLIPMFAYGTGAENFSKVMDNTEVPREMAKLLNVE